jgi:hypothetical protein
MVKIAGSRIRIRIHSSEAWVRGPDPDPPQNVMGPATLLITLKNCNQSPFINVNQDLGTSELQGGGDRAGPPHHRPPDPQQQQAGGGPPVGRLLRIQVREGMLKQPRGRE